MEDAKIVTMDGKHISFHADSIPFNTSKIWELRLKEGWHIRQVRQQSIYYKIQCKNAWKFSAYPSLSLVQG